MSKPMPVIPGTTYMFTRRCSERRFLMRPDAATNQIVLYCIIYAARRNGMVLHGIYVSSNHYHIIITDPYGNAVEFRRDCNSLISRAMNRLRRRRDSFWEYADRHCTELVDAGAQIEAFAYTVTNPVKDGLVEHGQQWPGIRTSPEDIGKTLVVKRPEGFFKPSMPETLAYELKMIPALETLPLPAAIAALRSAVDTMEIEARAERKKSGRRYVGARAIRATKPTSAPTTRASFRSLNPRIKCKDPLLRAQALERLQQFWQDHAIARAQWLDGNKDVQFPVGTHAFCTRAAPSQRRALA